MGFFLLQADGHQFVAFYNVCVLAVLLRQPGTVSVFLQVGCFRCHSKSNCSIHLAEDSLDCWVGLILEFFETTVQLTFDFYILRVQTLFYKPTMDVLLVKLHPANLVNT